jgi:GT2 family glycosyltransferase
MASMNRVDAGDRWRGLFRVPTAGDVAPVPPPTISVIVPAYQAATTIAEALDSALRQTVPAHDIVVCDDGSTDDTLRVLEPYRDRIVLIRKENGGGASAMNAAAAAATGEFLSILDADDIYGPDRIAALAALGSARPDLEILATDAHFVVAGRRTGRFYASNHFEVDDQRRAILQSCFIIGPAVRRRRLLEIGGFDEALAIGYDWDCWLRLILAGARAGLVDTPQLEYRATSGSLTEGRARNLESRLMVLQKAERHPALTADERRVLADSVRLHALRAAAARTRADLHEARPSALRRTLWAVARDHRLPVLFRMKATAAAVAPSVLAPWLFGDTDS